MKRINLLFLGMAIAGLAFGCGDDDGVDPVDSGTSDSGGGETDSGPPEDGAVPVANCPDGQPDQEGLMGGCCYRAANTGDRAAAPEFRVAGLVISAPGSLSNILIAGALQNALDEERGNWVMRIEGADADGEITITTGYGARNEDATFSFTMDAAPAPGEPGRWNPVSGTGTLTGEEITVPAIPAGFTVPIFEDGELSLELPLQALEITSLEMSENRSCVGSRGPARYVTGGSLSTFITVEAAKARRVEIPPISNSMCNLIAGMSSFEGDCDERPQAEWMVPPNSTCNEDGTCTAGGCAPADCNAWQITSDFAAQGVEITD